MDLDRDLRFSTLISIVFFIFVIDTHRVESRGTCHYFSVVKKNWETALDICMGMSMCLADFDTEKHFRILSSLTLSHSEYWVGLNRNFTEDWSYVSTHHSTRYLPLESSLSDEHHNCAVIRSSDQETFGVWAARCEEEKMFVCAESIFCMKEHQFSRYSSGYNSLPRHEGIACCR
ncbi:C-type lectin domain family 2 member D3-like [Drosophila miranda]|uniref:C-type lectin domain family 2 member D3-like n=1 Tax=Drosophila miranda TaxID=7229 RepID=UPI00143F8F4E|nr:C-type lectin domain family 2 member D3-like [Drosophila miranda]